MSLSQVENKLAKAEPRAAALAPSAPNPSLFRLGDYVFGLAGRLLAFMIVVVLLSVALLYATRLVAVQDLWARARIAAAYSAAEAFEPAGDASATAELN